MPFTTHYLIPGSTISTDSEYQNMTWKEYSYYYIVPVSAKSKRMFASEMSRMARGDKHPCTL